MNLDTTFRALREVARPSSRSRSPKAPPTLDRRSRPSRTSGRSCATRERLFARAAARRGRAAHGGADARRRAEAGIDGAAAHAARSTAGWPSLLGELQTSPRTRSSPRGVAHRPTALDELRPTLTYLAPAQTQCNYVTLWFRNVSSLLSEGDANGTWQRFIIIATPQGPNNEGGPSSAPANGPTRGQPPAHEPVPEHGGAGPAEGVRGGQRAVHRGPDHHRQRRRAPSRPGRRATP